MTTGLAAADRHLSDGRFLGFDRLEVVDSARAAFGKTSAGSVIAARERRRAPTLPDTPDALP